MSFPQQELLENYMGTRSLLAALNRLSKADVASQGFDSDHEQLSPRECQQIGNHQYKEGIWEQALLWFTRALAKLVCREILDEQTVGAVLCNRCVTLMKLARFAEAVEDASLAVELQPTLVKPRYRHACALRGLGRFQEAMDACDAGLRIEPKNEQLHGLRRQCYNELSKLRSAASAHRPPCDWKAFLVDSPLLEPGVEVGCKKATLAPDDASIGEGEVDASCNRKDHSFYRLRL